MENDNSIDARAEIVVKNFPIVSVGGLAGGVDASDRRLQKLPCDMESAIVIVNYKTIVPTSRFVLAHRTPGRQADCRQCLRLRR